VFMARPSKFRRSPGLYLSNVLSALFKLLAHLDNVRLYCADSNRCLWGLLRRCFGYARAIMKCTDVEENITYLSFSNLDLK
jgi:hypothetical protein